MSAPAARAQDAERAVDAMAAYYAQRAAIYERVYHRPWRQAGLRAMEAALPALFEGREVLEVACGTGWWTPHGALRAKRWLATDLNPETMAVARAKPLPAGVAFATADAYALDALAPRTFDAAFAGCWWSHVPLARLPGWLAMLHRRLRPGARVVFIDNRCIEGDSTPVHRVDADGNGYQWRQLDDGSRHEVLKNFPTPQQARAMLGMGVSGFEWTDHPHYWQLAYTVDDPLAER